tara:strand:- start:189 stop:605 length:417 start_codon:yes stop_codon:yes gene_type:complete
MSKDGIKSEKKRGLLPIMSPLYNMREICKQVALLEEHLNQPRKRCPDCIRKHFLTIEALFEEAISLDKDFKYDDYLDGKAEMCRLLQEEWLDGGDEQKIAQRLRTMRKEFAPICFDTRKMATVVIVAEKYLSFSTNCK